MDNNKKVVNIYYLSFFIVLNNLIRKGRKMDHLKILIIEEIGGIFSASFVGDVDEEFILLQYPANETVELLKNLIQFHSEEKDSICGELENIMSLILNEGVKIGKGDKKMVNEEKISPKDKDRKKIVDLLKKADPDKVLASKLAHQQYEIKKLVNQFRETYAEFPIERDDCNHPDFADIDCECYNYCELCGENWDR